MSIQSKPQKVRIAFVGLRFGNHLIERLLSSVDQQYFEIAAVCDIDRARADGVADKLGVPACYDLAQVLADPTIAAVGLFTPPNGRAALVRHAIQAGKHVMATKPFELDADSALAVLREAQSLGKVIHLNSPPPIPSPDLAQIQRWRDEYDLGRAIGGRADAWHGNGQRGPGRGRATDAKPLGHRTTVGRHGSVDHPF
jgi:predicted dehydrogenase